MPREARSSGGRGRSWRGDTPPSSKPRLSPHPAWKAPVHESQDSSTSMGEGLEASPNQTDRVSSWAARSLPVLLSEASPAPQTLPPPNVVAVRSLSHVRLCDPVDCSTPGFPVLHHLLELAQTHVHRVDDAIQPSHPLLPSSSPALSLSQHQGLFQ